MKRFIICLLLLLTISGCSDNSSNSEINENLKIGNEDESEAEVLLDKKVFYGEYTGTDKTYTGLEPLKPCEYNNEITISKGLNKTKIEHSYGVAENYKANEISINNQSFFDKNKFNAFTLDMTPDTKSVYLTFDVGYDNGYTEIILDTLKEKNVTAAFFCTVDEMKSNPEAIARMINEGHIVGNHTVTHPSMDELSREEMLNEVKGFDDYIRENFGYSSLYFRFPKGEYSEEALDLLGDMGYTSVFWSLAYADWNTSAQKGAAKAHDTVIARIHPGAVILLHAVSSDNAQALGNIIDSVRQLGYEFQSLENYRNTN